MRFLDLFAGIGGFRLGMEQAEHKCVGFCEIDKFARKSYKAIHNTEGEWTSHDITTVTDDEWRKFRGTVDVICGGFPCQSFSVAGKRQGFLDETRGTLFFEIARAAKQIKPRILFLENVKGLLSHDKGKTFGVILNTLDELGYDCEWQVLNSKNFGVPQNRERVFIIGHLRGTSGREVFPIERTDQATDIPVEIIAHRDGYRRNTQVFAPTGITEALDTGQGGGRGHYTIIDDQGRANKKLKHLDIVPTLRAQSHGNEPKIVIREATKKGYSEAQVGDSVNISHPKSKTRRGRGGKQIANTLLTGEEQAVVTNQYQIRKLTPRECWRLQGFPDRAFDRAAQVNSDSQLYKQAGNSVTVPVIFDIARRLV